MASRYLLVKAYIGFGDRLQCLSHAIDCAAKFSRTLCIESDSIWSDRTLGFEQFFDLCNGPTIVPGGFYRLEFECVSPLGWANQLDRRADSKFIHKSPYTCSLNHFTNSIAIHFQSVASKQDFNLQLLIVFFLILSAKSCVFDGELLFSTMARFIRGGDYTDLPGYDA